MKLLLRNGKECRECNMLLQKNAENKMGFRNERLPIAQPWEEVRRGRRGAGI